MALSSTEALSIIAAGNKGAEAAARDTRPGARFNGAFRSAAMHGFNRGTPEFSVFVACYLNACPPRVSIDPKTNLVLDLRPAATKTCGACGSQHLADRSCDCFDNGCQ